MNATQDIYPNRAARRTSTVTLVATVLVLGLTAAAGYFEDMGYTGAITGGIIVASHIVQRVLTTPAVSVWVSIHLPYLSATPRE